MCVIIADFKGILNQIAKNWEQRIVQLLKDHKDLEMIEEIGQVNNRETKWWSRNDEHDEDDWYIHQLLGKLLMKVWKP